MWRRYCPFYDTSTSAIYEQHIAYHFFAMTPWKHIIQNKRNLTNLMFAIAYGIKHYMISALWWLTVQKKSLVSYMTFVSLLFVPHLWLFFFFFFFCASGVMVACSGYLRYIFVWFLQNYSKIINGYERVECNVRVNATNCIRSTLTILLPSLISRRCVFNAAFVVFGQAHPGFTSGSLWSDFQCMVETSSVYLTSPHTLSYCRLYFHFLWAHYGIFGNGILLM